MYILMCFYKGFDQGWSVVAEENVLEHFTARSIIILGYFPASLYVQGIISDRLFAIWLTGHIRILLLFTYRSA
jgi:hypothetical protein